jgi:hypothetical protein
MEESNQQRPGFSRGQRWSIAFQVGISSLLLLAIVVMVNYLAARHPIRTEWTPDGRYQLAPLTRSVLATLTNEVKITVLYDPEESSLYTETRRLLDEYAVACPRVQVEYVNYGVRKGRAEALLSQNRITSGPDTLMILFEMAGRPAQVVRERELSIYDSSGAFRGETIRRIGFKGEQFITSKLQALAEGRNVRGYLLTGHGEPDPTDEDGVEGLFRFASLLAERNVDLQLLSLRTNAIPEDCQLLILVGPRYRVPADEVSRVERYLRSGGRALLLFRSAPLRSPGVTRTGLESLLADWGVELRDGIVMDKAQAQAGNTAMLLTDQFAPHPITSALRGARVGLIMPQAVFPGPESRPGAVGARVDPLLLTSAGGMIVRPLGGGEGLVETNGVIPLAVAVEHGAIAGVSLDRGAARLVVVGDATFVGNQSIEVAANRDFASLAVNWLLDRPQLLAIPPRQIRQYQINLTRAETHSLAWVLLGVLPGGVLTLGLAVWLRRRR